MCIIHPGTSKETNTCRDIIFVNQSWCWGCGDITTLIMHLEKFHVELCWYVLWCHSEHIIAQRWAWSGVSLQVLRLWAGTWGPQVDIENPSSTRNLMWLCTKQDSNWCSTSSTISTPALSQLLASSDWQANGKAGKISRVMTSIQWLVAATTLLTRNGIGDHSDLFHSSHVIDCPTETYSAKCASWQVALAYMSVLHIYILRPLDMCFADS